MSLFADFIPTGPGKQPAKVCWGGRDDDDDDNNVSPLADSWTEAGTANYASPVRYRRCVALVNDLGALCCGRIGNNGNVFCGAVGSKGCPTSHENKMSVLEARKATGAAALYYMSRSSAKIKLSVDPMLDAANLDTMEIEGLLQANFKDQGDWMHEVEARTQALLTGVSLAIARSTVKKPAVFNKMDNDEDMEDVTHGLTDMFNQAALDSPERASDKKPAAIEPKEEGWMTLVDKQIEKWMSSAHQKLKEDVRDLTTKYQMLCTQVGSPSAHLARAGQSIWEAIKDTGAPDLMKAVQDPYQLKALQEAVFQNQDFKKYLKSTKDTVQSITDRISNLELANANQSTAPAIATSLFDSFHVGVLAPSPAAAPAVLAQKVADLERAKNGNSSRGEITVVFKDQVFTSPRDVRSVFRMSPTSTSLVRLSMVYDAYILFDLVADRVFGYPDERKFSPDKAHRLNRSVKDLLHIQSSTLSGLPNFFDGSKSSKIFMDGSIKGSKASVFSNIKSHDIWGPFGTPNNCVRVAAERALDSIKLEYLNNPREGLDASVTVLLDAMLVRSVEFVKAVFLFLSNEYETLKLYFSEGDKCWNFLCNCVKQVFSSEFHVARAVSSSADHMNCDGTNVNVIWTALRTISIQEDFLRVGFENHSGLSSAYSRFMLTHMPNIAVTKLQTEMESTVKKVKAAEEKLTKVEGLANSAISKAAAAGGGKKKKEI
ncbi:predicted protein [Chaetoceros tenuissimus]|uniref:Uncharacterized protein n=1 Tax=Chaetoceros tenuissimus TaxID=426638 RepID=A0AAD3DDU8_9STRA|nr:predicted protein [Chaetoceros tenuissimus]